MLCLCAASLSFVFFFFFFFFNDTATTEIYTLSLHDALPIYFFVQPREAQAGVALLAARHIKRETLHGEALLPAAQIIQPDQPESEQARGIALRRRADGGPAVLPAAQKRARIAGRETGFQVRLGADLGQGP